MAWNQQIPQLAHFNPRFFRQTEQDASQGDYGGYPGGAEYGVREAPDERYWQHNGIESMVQHPSASSSYQQPGYHFQPFPSQHLQHNVQPNAVPQIQAQAPQAVPPTGQWPGSGWPQHGGAALQPGFTNGGWRRINQSTYTGGGQAYAPVQSAQPASTYQPTAFQPADWPAFFQSRIAGAIQQPGFTPNPQQAFQWQTGQGQNWQTALAPSLHSTPPAPAFRRPSPIYRDSPIQASAGYVDPYFGVIAEDTSTNPYDNVPFDLTFPGEKPRLYLLPQPAPTPEYLAIAEKGSVTIPIPRKLLIVLDLNGTLLVRNNNRTSFTERPHVQKFMHYVLAYHKVAIWSSARPHNVAAMVENLVSKEQRKQLVTIWARDKLRLGNHYNEKLQVYKQLPWLWVDPQVVNSFVESEANFGTRWDQTNTVLIDDSVEKAASEPFNLLKIDEFTRADLESGDEVLSQVVEYLEKLRWQSNASAWMKDCPFYAEPGKPGVDWTKFGWVDGKK